MSFESAQPIQPAQPTQPEKLKLSYEEVKKLIRDNGIKNLYKYFIFRLERPDLNLPEDPTTIEGWVSEEDFFATKYLDLKEKIQDLRRKGIIIKNINDYQDYLKANPELNWPYSPYRELVSWISNEDFFGLEKAQEKEEITYEELKKAVQEAGIKNYLGYRDHIMQKYHDGEELNWPDKPADMKGWVSFEDFFGSN